MRMSNTSYTMPTLEEIELYQKGKLGPARAAEIKSLANSNPLVAEALEGFAILPVFAAVPGSESFLNMLANAPGSAAASGTASSAAAASGGAVATDAAVKTVAWFGTKTLIIAGISATIAITGTLFFVNQSSETPSTTQNNTSESTQSSQTSDLSEPTAVVSSNASSESTSISGLSADGLAVNENTTVAHQDAQIQNTSGNEIVPSGVAPANATFTSDDTGHTYPSIPNPADVSSTPADSEASITRSDISDKVMAIGIQSILHYKVADYTKVVKKNWVEFDINPRGVPAQYENEEAKLAAEQEEVVKDIPYLDYLTLCIRAMDNKDYKLALSQFQLVLDQYPEDVNGLFYSAQCNYYLGNYDKAIALYDLTMRNMINKFDEESEFYKAKSLKALGRTDDAKKLFEAIVAKGKFYSEKAVKELEQ